MKTLAKYIVIASVVTLISGCKDPRVGTPTPGYPPAPDPDAELQNQCIAITDDPDMSSAKRLTNECDFTVNLKFCAAPDGRPECTNPEKPALKPKGWTRAFPRGPEAIVKFAACKALTNDSYFYDPEYVEFRDNQTCDKK